MRPPSIFTPHKPFLFRVDDKIVVLQARNIGHAAAGFSTLFDVLKIEPTGAVMHAVDPDGRRFEGGYRQPREGALHFTFTESERPLAAVRPYGVNIMGRTNYHAVTARSEDHAVATVLGRRCRWLRPTILGVSVGFERYGLVFVVPRIVSFIHPGSVVPLKRAA